MRFSAVFMTLLITVLIAGCSREVSGTARPDPRTPPVAVTEDGSGVIAGFSDAPIQVEIFTEPQCNHCADLQADFGDDLAGYINLGQLAVTYRPLTFFDNEPDGYSARVSNAMFAAADPATSATEFQTFVEELWASQDVFGSGPTDDELAETARTAGVPEAVVDRIGRGETAVDVAEMADSNFGFLYQTDPLNPGTPTVYDLNGDEVLDIYDDNWLTTLMMSA